MKPHFVMLASGAKNCEFCGDVLACQCQQGDCGFPVNPGFFCRRCGKPFIDLPNSVTNKETAEAKARQVDEFLRQFEALRSDQPNATESSLPSGCRTVDGVHTVDRLRLQSFPAKGNFFRQMARWDARYQIERCRCRVQPPDHSAFLRLYAEHEGALQSFVRARWSAHVKKRRK